MLYVEGLGGEMRRGLQRVMHCPCGNAKVLAHGLCATCYTLKRQDAAYFGGLREKVLERDGYRCRVCAELPEVERLCIGQPPSVHHRVAGVSQLHLMITLCAAHHAQIGRLRVAAKPMSPLLRTLWREQHPDGHEQTPLDFSASVPAAAGDRLFEDGRVEGLPLER